MPDDGSIAPLTAAYPIVDLLLLGVAVAALVMLGRGAGWSWSLLCASFVTFFVTDAVYAQMVADGTYTGGQPVDAGWLGARLLLVGAALVSLHQTESWTVDLEGVSVLALPGLCGLAVLGLLFHGSRVGISTFAAVVALSAGALMVGRTTLTFRELRTLTEARERALSERLVEAQDDERARIAADVHDDSIQVLAAVDLRLGALLNRLRDRAPKEVPGVETVMDAVRGASGRLRHLMFELETPVLDTTLSERPSRRGCPDLRGLRRRLVGGRPRRGAAAPAGPCLCVPDRSRGDGQCSEARSGDVRRRHHRCDRCRRGGARRGRRQGAGPHGPGTLDPPPLRRGGDARPRVGLRWLVAVGAGRGRDRHRRVVLPPVGRRHRGRCERWPPGAPEP